MILTYLSHGANEVLGGFKVAIAEELIVVRDGVEKFCIPRHALRQASVSLVELQELLSRF